MFRFLCVLYFLCIALPGALSPQESLTDINKPTKSDTFGQQPARCNWTCVVDNKSTDFVEEIKARLGKFRIVSLDLTLRQYVDDKCLNQTDFYNSSKPADAWMWSTLNTLTHEKNVFYRHQVGSNGSSVTLFIKSVQGQIKGNVICTFNLSKDPNSQQPHSSINDLIAKVLMEEVEEAPEVWQSGAVLCNKEREQNSLYVCLNLDKKTESMEWPVRTLSAGEGGVTILILVISILFFPAVLCLFSPTQVCSIKNIDLIVLEGPSHISIRGLVANFVSKESLKLLAKSCLHFLFNLLISFAILSFPFDSHPFSFANLYKSLHKRITDPCGIVTLNVMFTICFLCSIRGLMRVCFTRWSFKQPCFVCHFLNAVKTFHHDQASELKDEIEQHLRIQPLIIPKCWHLVSDYFKKLRMYLPKWDDEDPTRRLWANICLFISALVLLIALLVLLVIFLVFILFLLFYSCPMSTIFDFYASKIIITDGGHRYLLAYHVMLLSVKLILPYAGVVSLLLLMSASAFIKALTTISSVENFPFVTFVVLGIFYCSKCYYSFTRKYDDLAAKLFRVLKKRVQQDGNLHAHILKHNKMKAIPESLFDKACQETMPLAEHICELLLRIVTILISFCLIYIIVKETQGVPERIKNTATLLVGPIPMIIEMVVLKKGDKMKELKQEELDEKISSIVDEYYNNPADWIELPKSKYRGGCVKKGNREFFSVVRSSIRKLAK